MAAVYPSGGGGEVWVHYGGKTAFLLSGAIAAAIAVSAFPSLPSCQEIGRPKTAILL